MEIIRTSYINQLDQMKDTNKIKVIVGVRRSGKSVILKQFRDFLISKYAIKNNTNIIFIQINELLNKETLTWQQLVKIIENSTKKSSNKIYLFLDEIQEINNFQHALRYLYEKEVYDIYVTGSSSKMLSGEISSELGARAFEIHVYPFSLSEYIKYFKKNKLSRDISYIYDSYLKYGGFPTILELLSNPNLIIKEHESIQNTILLNDVISRHKIRNISEFKKIVRFAIDDFGQTVSSLSIAQFLNKNNLVKTSSFTISNYYNWLCETFFLQIIYPIHIGKNILKNSQKYYLVDHGIRNSLIGITHESIGITLENIVLIELLRRGYKINVGKLPNGKEIDFVVSKNNKIAYIQVTNFITSQSDNPKLWEREIGNLLQITDNYEKILIVGMKPHFDSHKGIKIVYIVDWLLKQSEVNEI